MTAYPDFRQRWQGSELMDDPACDTATLWRTLDRFASLNRLVSRYRSILSAWVLDDMARTDAKRQWHLVDVGAGGCDIALWLLREARRRGLKLTVTAVDNDPRVIAYARHRHDRQPGLRIQPAELHDINALRPFDYLFANHVLHHLPDDGIPDALAAMQAATGRRWVISDIRRSRWAYLGFQILGLGYRNGFAAEDGLRSIRRGFTAADLRGYLKTAGLEQAVILRHYAPARLCLIGTATPLSARQNQENRKRSHLRRQATWKLRVPSRMTTHGTNGQGTFSGHHQDRPPCGKTVNGGD